MKLDPEAYARAKAIFNKVLEVHKDQRAAVLREECQGREDIRAEVESLLYFHDSTPTWKTTDLPSMTIAFENRFRRLVQNRVLRFAWLPLLLLLLAFATAIGRQAINDALKRGITDQLQSVLNSTFHGLDLWSSLRFEEAARFADMLRDRPELATLLQLSRTSVNPEVTLVDHPAQKQLQQLMQEIVRSGQFKYFNIFDDNYRNIASNELTAVGKKTLPNTELMQLMDRILKGESLFTPRRLLGSAYPNDDVIRRKEYVSWFAVPIRNSSGQIIAGLALAIDTTRSFDKILNTGRWGQSGETLAFNSQGLMLSESRFMEQLVTTRLLQPGETSALKIYLKDPGGNLLQGHKSESRPEDWPFIRIISKALDRQRAYSQQMDGVVLEPYRDYRGVPMIGAWRWHPSLHFGLITEMEADEALLTLRLVNGFYMAMIILFVAVSILASLAYFTVMKLRPAARLGSRMGQYRLLRKIAEGGIGEIFLARHEFLKRPTAIKILKNDRTDPEALARFEAEVQATSQLTHPNTVAIYDYGRTTNGSFYYAMEYLAGISLAKLIETEKRIPWPRAVHLLLQMCGSLREAHALGLVHRDIKPLNIMICRVGWEYDVVKVVDFGLVKRLKSLSAWEAVEAVPDQLRGTPGYLAPELLLQPLAANASSDIYSLGVVAYKMLCGHNLFDAHHEAGLLYDVLHTPPKELSEVFPDLPEPLVRLIMQCVEKNPQARPPHVEALAAELQKMAAQQPWTQQEARQWWTVRDHLLLLPE